MRLASIRHQEQVVPAVMDGDLAVLIDDIARDLVDLAEQGEAGIESVRAALADPKRARIADFGYAAPITRFRRDVLCCGWNYWDHFEESRGKREGQDVDRPNAPTFFTKSPGSVVGPFDPIAFDSTVSSKWDYEAEIALVIGKGGRSIPRARARDHVFGITLANDISQRDLQRRHGGQWLKGKSIDGTMPLGPVIVTPDSCNFDDLWIECLLNGQRMQWASTRQMAFPIDEIIAELSFGMTLNPGDVILTGTPAGIGNAREPPVFLKEGDRVVVSVQGIGELNNRLERVDLRGESEVSVG
ncbi:hypothetical protein N185_32335 [Sinorhizobium sp. GW3]|nr:hypothetical protein N185_32335 [Sinorhizobium sp. GW3]